jgi:hypothetical protein
MSGVGGSKMGEVLAMIAGAVAAKVVSNKLADKVNPKILAGGEIVLGYFMPKLIKNKIAASVGAGMAVGGGVNLLSSFGVISGISGIGESMDVEMMSGYDDMDADMGATSSDNLQSIAGGLTDYGIMSGDNLSILSGDDMDEEY